MRCCSALFLGETIGAPALPGGIGCCPDIAPCVDRGQARAAVRAEAADVLLEAQAALAGGDAAKRRASAPQSKPLPRSVVMARQRSDQRRQAAEQARTGALPSAVLLARQRSELNSPGGASRRASKMTAKATGGRCLRSVVVRCAFVASTAAHASARTLVTAPSSSYPYTRRTHAHTYTDKLHLHAIP